MKRVLSLVLVVALLLSFASFVGAVPLEDDLQAQGRAMLEETLEILDSNRFTLVANWFEFGEVFDETITRNGDDFVSEVSIRVFYPGITMLQRLVFGNYVRRISTTQQLSVVFPNRRIVFASREHTDDDNLWQSLLQEHNSFRSAALPENFTTHTFVSFDRHMGVNVLDEHGWRHATYYFNDGQLEGISNRLVTRSIQSLSPGIDESVFRTRGMIPLLLLALMPIVQVPVLIAFFGLARTTP